MDVRTGRGGEGEGVREGVREGGVDRGNYRIDV